MAGFLEANKSWFEWSAPFLLPSTLGIAGAGEDTAGGLRKGVSEKSEGFEQCLPATEGWGQGRAGRHQICGKERLFRVPFQSLVGRSGVQG